MSSRALWVSWVLFFNLLAAAHAGPSKQSAVVDRALTGDTVLLQGGKTLRYIGVSSYPIQSKIVLVREYAQSAQVFNESLVGGKKIEIEWGARIRDDQDRFLGYVFLEDGRFVNREILAAGQGKARIVAPNTKHAEELRSAEAEARKQRAGLWQKEPKDPFADKQVIGEKNTKVYYFPRSAELTRIPEAQLVYFGSRVDAVAAGYRPCHDCRANSPDETE